MAGSLQPRVKVWVSTEDVVYSDLNAEFDNVLTAMQPLLMDDYSTNVAQMQVRTDPGEVGSESLATTLAGEIARIRNMLAEITGETQWYTSPVSSLLGLSNAIGTGLSDNRLVSGRVRTGSQMPVFLVPHGAARTVTVKGATTNFRYYVEGVEYVITTDVTLTNLTAAPSTNNTCLVNDAVAADQDYTKHTGENGTEIIIDTVGSEITALVGKFAAFKLDNGSATEYFIAKVETNRLIQAKRGYFFNSSDNPIPRVAYSNNDTITLMKLAWIFAKIDGTLTVSYTNPVYGKDEPTSPSSGDFWFDTDNNKWMRYDVSSFIDADAVLIGQCIQDSSNTVAARSFEFFANYADLNTVELFAESNSQVKSRWPGSQLNVWGYSIKFEHNNLTWDMTANLDSGVSETSSTYYYFYVTEEGDLIISDVRPYDRREDLLGYYHPHQSWKCVGSAFNNASSNLTSVESFYNRYESFPVSPVQTAASRIEVVDAMTLVDTSGGAFTKTLPPAAYWRGQQMVFTKTTSDFTAATLSTTNSENIIEGATSATSTTLNTIGESITLFSDGTDIRVINRSIPSVWTTYTVTVTAVSSNPTKASSATVDVGKWRRVGDSIEVSWTFSAPNNSGAADGSGIYLYSLPGVTADSVKAQVSTTAESATQVGWGFWNNGSTRIFPAQMYLYDTTHLAARYFTGSASTDVASGNGFNTAGGWKMSFFAVIPVSGWLS